MRERHILQVAENVSTPPKAFSGSRTYIATGDVDSDGIVGGVPVTFSERPSRANLEAGEGDIIFAKMMSTNKTVHITDSAKGNLYSTGFFCLRPDKSVVFPRYLYWYLRSREFQFAKDTRCTGATQKALTLSGLREIRLPLPQDLGEQARIASTLDKADEIIREQRSMFDLANELLMATFLDRFGDPSSNPKRLSQKRLAEFGRIVTGNTPPRNNPQNFGEAVEWIKSDNLNTPDHIVSAASEGLSLLGKSVAKIVQAGSTLVTCIAGSPSSIGNAAFVDREVAFNQQINAVEPNRDTDPLFLYVHFLASKGLVQAASTNSMKGMVSKGKLQEIKFLAPSIEDQRAFGAIASEVLSLIKTTLSEISDAADLFGAVSQGAFGLGDRNANQAA